MLLFEERGKEVRDDNEKVVVKANVAGMPFCCGVEVVGNFNGGYRKFDDRKLLEEVAARDFPGIQLATTVDWQPEAIEELKKQGFVPVIKWWNAVHADWEHPKGNQITLWVKQRPDGNMEFVPQDGER